MRSAILLLLPASILAGCVSAQTSVVYGTFEEPVDRPITFCENYAEQTFYSVYNTLYDSEDSFGANSFARNRAERAADQAYQRCLSGRTN